MITTFLPALLFYLPLCRALNNPPRPGPTGVSLNDTTPGTHGGILLPDDPPGGGLGVCSTRSVTRWHLSSHLAWRDRACRLTGLFPPILVQSLGIAVSPHNVAEYPDVWLVAPGGSQHVPRVRDNGSVAHLGLTGDRLRCGIGDFMSVEGAVSVGVDLGGIIVRIVEVHEEEEVGIQVIYAPLRHASQGCWRAGLRRSHKSCLRDKVRMNTLITKSKGLRGYRVSGQLTGYSEFVQALRRKVSARLTDGMSKAVDKFRRGWSSDRQSLTHRWLQQNGP